MKVGFQLTNQTVLDNSYEDINFLEKMVKPIWIGSDQDLKLFRDTFIKNTYINQEQLLSSYNISKDRIEEIRKELNRSVEDYLKTIVENNNMVELRALVGSTMKELNDRYMDGSLESMYPFKNNSINEAFYNKGNALKGDRARVESLDFETLVLNTTGLSKEAKEELYNTIKNTTIQSIFSVISKDEDYIRVVYSRQGLNEYNQSWFKSKQLNTTSNILLSDSKDINSRSLKIFETIAKEMPALMINKKDKLGNNLSLITSNDVLGVENEFVADLKEKEEQKINIIKDVKKENMIDRRGSNPKDAMLKEILNQDPDNPKSEIKVKRELTDIIDVRNINREDIAKQIKDLELKMFEEKFNKANSIAEEVSVKFIQYIEAGKSIEEANKLINEFTRGNEFASKIGITLATKGLLEIKETNNVLNEKLNVATNKIEEAINQIDLLNNLVVKQEENLKNQAEEFKVEIDKKDTLNNELLLTVKELNDENQVLFNDKKDLELIKETLTKEVNELNNTNNSLIELIDQEQSKNNTLSNTINTLNNTINSKDNEIIKLDESLNAKIYEISSLNENIITLNDKLNVANETINSKDNEINKLTETINSKDETINKLEERITNILTIEETKDNRINELEKQIKILQEQLLQQNKQVVVEEKKVEQVIEQKVDEVKPEYKRINIEKESVLNDDFSKIKDKLESFSDQVKIEKNDELEEKVEIDSVENEKAKNNIIKMENEKLEDMSSLKDELTKLMNGNDNTNEDTNRHNRN